MAKKRFVLRVDLESPLTEARAALPFFGRRGRGDLWSLLQILRQALSSDRVGGVLLHLNRGAGIGWSKAASLSRALLEIREAGKLTVSFLEAAGHAEYLSAAACEKIVLSPGSTLSLVGLRAEAFFFKDLLERAGVEADLAAVGDYKSAGDLFSRREMSAAHREQLQSILGDLTDQMVSGIAEGRRLSPDRARALLLGGPYLAEEAKALGLIDLVAYPDSAEGLFEEKLGGKPFFLPHVRLPLDESLLRRALGRRRPQVAVVHLHGVIGAPNPSGRGAPSGVSAARELLKRVRESKKVRAVVLRVDSPGGDAISSELLWREVALTRKAKPVVVSMGDVAASGGYYVACAADAIVAEGTTLTGSIGVLGGKVVFDRLLAKLGIRREAVSLSERSGFYSPFERWNDRDRETTEAHIEHFYEKLFLPRVSEGRGLTLERARELGGGRVWTGRQGKELGLVDALGDLATAVDLAREKAGIPKETRLRVVSYQERRRLIDLVPFRRPWAVTDWLSEVLAVLEFASTAEVFLLMPWWLRIR